MIVQANHPGKPRRPGGNPEHPAVQTAGGRSQAGPTSRKESGTSGPTQTKHALWIGIWAEHSGKGRMIRAMAGRPVSIKHLMGCPKSFGPNFARGVHRLVIGPMCTGYAVNGHILKKSLAFLWWMKLGGLAYVYCMFPHFSSEHLDPLNSAVIL